MLQFLILEGFYVWGRTRSLFWAACVLVAFNMIKGMLLLADMARVWPVREEVRSIAAALGIPNMLDYALRLLGGQALGVVTMLLIVVRFVALGGSIASAGVYASRGARDDGLDLGFLPGDGKGHLLKAFVPQLALAPAYTVRWCTWWSPEG